MTPNLIQLYQQMYELTEPECRLNCRCPQSCCSPEYCQMATEIAIRDGVTFEVQNHPRLPFMGPKGCIVPPHYRPLCTLHVCSINGVGFKPGDPDWTQKYFDLRAEIEDAETDAQEQRDQEEEMRDEENWADAVDRSRNEP